jgi:hypothetical protein
MSHCPRCGCYAEDVGWESGACVLCGLEYEIDSCGELWSVEEYSFPVWKSFEPIDPKEFGRRHYIAEVESDHDIQCPFHDGTKEYLLWFDGYQAAKHDVSGDIK